MQDETGEDVDILTLAIEQGVRGAEMFAALASLREVNRKQEKEWRWTKAWR